MDIDPSREDSVERRQEEQERMGEAYKQLEEDLRVENLEQWRRRMDNEEQRKGQDWEMKWMKEKEGEWERKEEERKRKEYEQWKRKKEEAYSESWERLERLDNERKEEKQTKQKAAEPAYEKLQAEVKKYDDGMVAGWKEDIDTLLVFAGLFSAVVTAFLIESYQWLSEDTTVVLLTQISEQLNGTQTQPTPFTPEASSIRINCFWFLSLIFSLTSALFGLLCKQWLREHQRDVPTRTAAENLALRQLRRDSFEKWGVASFLSALPILLEIALVFFFAGVLDLLWTLQPMVFGTCLAAISLTMGLYVLTTILPTITIPRDQTRFIDTATKNEYGFYDHHHDFGQLAYQFICPYKSPQAWAVYKLFTTLPKLLLRFTFINNFTKIRLRPLWDHIQAQTSSWSTFDLRVVRQFDQEVCSLYFHPFRLQVYELQALQWAVTMFRDGPSMIPHLENVLETLPRSVAISAVLDQWDIMMWEGREWDVGVYLWNPPMSPKPKPVTSDPPLHSQEGIELLFWHRLWGVIVERGDVGDLSKSLEDFTQKLPKSSRNFQFFIPLPLATALWSHKEPRVQQLGLLLLRHFEESWKPSPGYDEERHNKERVAFVNGLSEHIYHSDPPSVLLMSKRGQEFIRFIHHGIIIRRLYSRDDFWRYGWQHVIEKVQEVGKLPDDYFAPLPEGHEDPPPSSQLPQLEPIRYSQDTVHPQSNSPRDEDGERPSSPAGNVENLEIQVLGSHGNTTSGIPDIADAALIPSSANQGGSSSQVLNEDSAFLPDNGTSARAVAEDTNPQDSDIQVAVSQGVAEGVSVPLSAGNNDNEPAVPSEAVPPDTDPDRFAQATKDVAQAVSLPLEEHGEPAGVDHRGQAIVTTGGIAADSGQDIHTVGDNISLAILEPPDHCVTGTSPSRQGDSVGVDGVSGRVGWNPTNDPNSLRVHWFRP